MEHEVQPPLLQFQFISVVASVASFRIIAMICLTGGQLAIMHETGIWCQKM
jgi:hypothetical protein